MSTTQYPAEHARLECFKWFWIWITNDVLKIFSPGRRRPPTTTGSQKASEVKGTTVGTLMADLAHGGTRVIVFVIVIVNSKEVTERTDNFFRTTQKQLFQVLHR